MATQKYQKGKDGYFRTKVWDGTYNKVGTKHRINVKSAKSSRDLERQLDEARAKIAALEAELREADRLNRKLTARLLVDGVGDNADANNTGKASDGYG